jgi:pimeloyl-ACP methyl ester carboxylesterase
MPDPRARSATRPGRAGLPHEGDAVPRSSHAPSSGATTRRRARAAAAGSGRPGRLDPPDRHAALAAPRAADGFTSHWYRRGRLRLHVRQRHSGSAVPAVVLLHGLAVSHRYLMPTARALHRRRAVYVPDLPGFGLSDKPSEVLDVGGHADVLAGWLDSLDTAPVALLGNSFGCQVAVELTRRRPDLVEALILVGPTTDPTAATMWGQLRRLALDLLFEDWRQAPILLADIRDAGPRRILATLRHAVRDRIETKLPSIRVPTLLARGAHDRIAPRRWLSHAAALTPDARTHIIEGAAHNAVTTAGPQLAAAVDAFLGSPHVPSGRPVRWLQKESGG